MTCPGRPKPDGLAYSKVSTASVLKPSTSRVKTVGVGPGAIVVVVVVGVAAVEVVVVVVVAVVVVAVVAGICVVAGVNGTKNTRKRR